MAEEINIESADREWAKHLESKSDAASKMTDKVKFYLQKTVAFSHGEPANPYDLVDGKPPKPEKETITVEEFLRSRLHEYIKDPLFDRGNIRGEYDQFLKALREVEGGVIGANTDFAKTVINFHKYQQGEYTGFGGVLRKIYQVIDDKMKRDEHTPEDIDYRNAVDKCMTEFSKEFPRPKAKKNPNSPIDQFLDVELDWQGQDETIETILLQRLPEYLVEKGLIDISQNFHKFASALDILKDENETDRATESAQSDVRTEMNYYENYKTSSFFEAISSLRRIAEKQADQGLEDQAVQANNAARTIIEISEKMKQYLGPMLGQGQEHSR